MMKGVCNFLYLYVTGTNSHYSFAFEVQFKVLEAILGLFTISSIFFLSKFSTKKIFVLMWV